MILINLKQIVRPLLLIFILFLNPLLASGLKVVRIEPVSGGYGIFQTEIGNKIQFLDLNIRVDDQGFFAIGFGREFQGIYDISVTQRDGEVDDWPIRISLRTFRVQSIKGLKPALVEPPVEVTQRIIREAKMVNAARAAGQTHMYWREEPFVWPAKGRLTGVYGSQRIYNDKPGSPHWGIDVAAPKGSSVVAPASGTIVLAEKDLYFSGGTLVLDHGGGLSSSFLHLSKLVVKPGQQVSQGQKIAEIGSTGRSTGPHLDWRMNLNGQRIDAAFWAPSAKP